MNRYILIVYADYACTPVLEAVCDVPAEMVELIQSAEQQAAFKETIRHIEAAGNNAEAYCAVMDTCGLCEPLKKATELVKVYRVDSYYVVEVPSFSMPTTFDSLKAKYDVLVAETADWMYANLTGEIDKTFVLNEATRIVFKPQSNSVDVVGYTLGTSFQLGEVHKNGRVVQYVGTGFHERLVDAALLTAKKLLGGTV